jgi:3-dehydroquinate synthase
VAEDEKEAGIRAILNLGHTFGHAIEAAMGYGNWLHGEAVAAGIVMAAELSCQENLIGPDDVKRVRSIIQRAGLPTTPPKEMDVDTFISLMSRDKKAEQGKINFILLEALGKARVSGQVSHGALVASLESQL